jgi:hypothetical protein
MRAGAKLEFGATACADLDEQERRLEALTGGALFLELSPMRAKSIVREFVPWIFTLSEPDRVVGVAAGFLRSARVGRSLVVVLATEVPDGDALWNGLRDFARARRVAALCAESIGVGHPPVPRLPGERQRLVAETFLIELACHDPQGSLATNHMRNVKRALRAGADVVELPADEAVRSHLAVLNASLGRTAARGGEVTGGPGAKTLHAYLETGRARFVQVGIDGRVHSSDLVVRLGDAAYYMSGGTSPEGMKLGTAHLAMLRVIEHLKQAGARTLSFGYPNPPGLARFKAGFGARAIPVERVEADWGSPLVSALRRVGERLRRRSSV